MVAKMMGRSVAGVAESWENGWGIQKAQASSYKFSDAMYYMVPIINNTILCIWKLLGEDLRSCHHEKKKSLFAVIDTN